MADSRNLIGAVKQGLGNRVLIQHRRELQMPEIQMRYAGRCRTMILGANGHGIKPIGDTQTLHKAAQPIRLNITGANMGQSKILFQFIRLGVIHHILSIAH